MFLSMTESEEARESLEQVKGLLWPLQSQLERTIQNSPYAPYLKRKLGYVHLPLVISFYAFVLLEILMKNILFEIVIMYVVMYEFIMYIFYLQRNHFTAWEAE